MKSLAYEVFEEFKEDYENNSHIEKQYLDEWDYEDDYSHNEIDNAREDFIFMANEFLEKAKSPYEMGYVGICAMICDRETGKYVKKAEVIKHE